MASLLSCYHHSNCADRPAVATCSICGKGLCAECSEKFRSKLDRQIICIDCTNQELLEIEAYFAMEQEEKERTFKKLKLGFILAAVAALVCAILLQRSWLSNPDFEAIMQFIFGCIAFTAVTIPFFAFITAAIPFAFSFSRGHGLILGIIFFLLAIIASPIVGAVIIIRALSGRKSLRNNLIKFEQVRKTYNDAFLNARALSTGSANLESVKAEYEAALSEINDLKNKLANTQNISENLEEINLMKTQLAEKEKLMEDKNNEINTLKMTISEQHSEIEDARKWINDMVAFKHSNKSVFGNKKKNAA